MRANNNKNNNNPSKNLRTSKGFTLVEMMVAIAVFSIVMVTAMSALLNVIDANNKARAIKTAINNVSFALEGISKDMRMGTDYICGDDADNMIATSSNCSSSGGKIIGYKSPRADPPGGYVFYRFVIDDTTNKGRIEECLERNKTCGINDFSPITSNEVDIRDVTFYVLGSDDITKQPRMVITVSGEAGGNKDKIKTAFDLQTSISQRIRPKNI